MGGRARPNGHGPAAHGFERRERPSSGAYGSAGSGGGGAEQPDAPEPGDSVELCPVIRRDRPRGDAPLGRRARRPCMRCHAAQRPLAEVFARSRLVVVTDVVSVVSGDLILGVGLLGTLPFVMATRRIDGSNRGNERIRDGGLTFDSRAGSFSHECCAHGLRL